MKIHVLELAFSNSGSFFYYLENYPCYAWNPNMYYTIVVAKLDNARREKMGTKRHKGVENLDT